PHHARAAAVPPGRRRRAAVRPLPLRPRLVGGRRDPPRVPFRRDALRRRALGLPLRREANMVPARTSRMTPVTPPAVPVPPVPLPIVTVIVPVRNEARSLRACLGSLLAQTYPAERLEILVVDGLSEDGTAALAREIAGGAAAAVRVLAN